MRRFMTVTAMLMLAGCSTTPPEDEGNRVAGWKLFDLPRTAEIADSCTRIYVDSTDIANCNRWTVNYGDRNKPSISPYDVQYAAFRNGDPAPQDLDYRNHLNDVDVTVTAAPDAAFIPQVHTQFNPAAIVHVQKGTGVNGNKINTYRVW